MKKKRTYFYGKPHGSDIDNDTKLKDIIKDYLYGLRASGNAGSCEDFDSFVNIFYGDLSEARKKKVKRMIRQRKRWI